MAYFWKTVPFPCKWPIKKPETKTRRCKFSLSYASAANGLFCLSLFDYPFFEMMMTHCRAVCDRSLPVGTREEHTKNRENFETPIPSPWGGGSLLKAKSLLHDFFLLPPRMQKFGRSSRQGRGGGAPLIIFWRALAGNSWSGEGVVPTFERTDRDRAATHRPQPH